MRVFDDITLDELAERWIGYKEAEKVAVECRREIEDEIARKVSFPGASRVTVCN
jgi:plasmid stabilization system protein ParE